MKKLFIFLIICMLISALSYLMLFRTAYVPMSSPPAPIFPPAPAPAPPNDRYAIQEQLVTRDAPHQTIFEISTQDKIEGFFVQLYNTAIAFTVPEKVNIAESFEVRALIDPTKTESELVRIICSQDPCENQTFSDTIPVSRVVVSELKGKGFNIKAITPEKQPISFTEPTEWIWQVEPTEVGIRKLFLTVNAIVEVDGEKETRQLRTFKKPITIEITTAQIVNNWFKDNWQWFWSALIVPIFVYIWSQRKKKRGASRR